jgi:hypothetical protein
MKKLLMLLFAVTTLSIAPLSAESDSWHEKAVGFFCDHSICRCQVYYEDGRCWVIVDETGQKCNVFRVTDNNTYNAAFRYDDCVYYLLVRYWPMD